MSEVKLSTNQPDFEALRAKLQSNLQGRDSWQGILPTQTGQTLIDFIASVGAFSAAKAVTLFRDCFSETAASDRAQYAIADTQGLRLNRKTPATASATATYVQPVGGPAQLSIPEFTQFQGAGSYWFNETAFQISAGQTVTFTLHQGYVVEWTLPGRGVDHASWVSQEAGFSVSDVANHVSVFKNDVPVQRVTTPLWLHRGVSAFLDNTTPDGRLQLRFGVSDYGYRPATTDTVRIRYVVTSGSDANQLVTLGMKPTTENVIGGGLTYEFTANPSGGANQPSASTLKHVGASNFGAFGSAVTKSQYLAAASDYPGVRDSKTYAQRELDPSDLRLMNVIRAVVLLENPGSWSAAQKEAYLQEMQRKSMYSPRWVWIDPVPVPRNLTVVVYCYAWANPTQCAQDAEAAARLLLQPKRGHLGRDLLLNDLHVQMKASNPGIESLDIITPSDDMFVSARPMTAPRLTFTPSILPNSLPAGTYSYAVYASDGFGDTAPVYYTSILIPSTGTITIEWDPYPNAGGYTVVGRGAINGRLVSLVASGPRSFIDDGLFTPNTSTALPTLASYPALYNSANVINVTGEYTRREIQ